jgi:DNA-binding transcriptional regulator YiaG
MPNIASVLKAEVTRLARRELRAQTDGLKKSLAAYRAEIAALRKRVAELERGAKQAGRQAAARKPRVATDVVESADGSGLRFRAAGMAANRKRLGLSAADFALLVGTTGQSVFAWESGKTKPRGAHLAAIASLRGIGKREVAERLAALR